MLQDCLAGVKVLDLSQYIPGPFATLLMADLGAEVVKVEPPHGDPMIAFEPRDADGVSPYYKAVNAGKTVVRLDLKAPEGKAALEGLVATADVLLESFRPGVLDRLGFGPDRLRVLNPGLVHCALSGFGQSGPWRLRAGHDITYMALAGVLGLNGPATEPPHMPFPPVADHVSALVAVNAVLAALLRKGRTGEGGSVDVSIFESALHLNYQALLLAQRGLDAPAREGDLLNGGVACYRTYRCADGRFLAVGALEPKFWEAFCAAVGRPEWVARQGEPLPQTDLISQVTDHLAGQSMAAWAEVLADVDCCVEPVLTPQEALAQPHVRERALATLGKDDLDLRFPAWAAGAPPPPRRPLREATVDAVQSAWS
ncbi:CaiB/BaiF CoA transferase family protein [Novispirillum sp. DQ9]|uniref:CaiB/BaiF CoA transferase family protein n=1 Tax=Novispirillum sp. DQ9 TaxID=3398612 RepID=UPI003C7DD572